MKFPERLSKERLFLLSKEDRAIYEQEWKDISADKTVIAPIYSKDNCFVESRIVSNQLEEIYEDLFCDIIDEKQYKSYLKDIDKDSKFLVNEQLYLSENEAVMNEAVMIEAVGGQGFDHYHWLQGTGWLGKLFIAGLGLLATACGYLIKMGFDYIAMAKLKSFMNKLVEVIDQGILKRRSWLSYFTKNKWRGEFNVACFRQIQETADRDMALGVMQAAKKLGYFAPGQMKSISSGSAPQDGGGLSMFNDNVLSQLNVLVPKDKDTVIKANKKSGDITQK